MGRDKACSLVLAHVQNCYSIFQRSEGLKGRRVGIAGRFARSGIQSLALAVSSSQDSIGSAERTEGQPFESIHCSL